jgi:hypothetical protein
MTSDVPDLLAQDGVTANERELSIDCGIHKETSKQTRIIEEWCRRFSIDLNGTMASFGPKDRKLIVSVARGRPP